MQDLSESEEELAERWRRCVIEGQGSFDEIGWSPVIITVSAEAYDELLERLEEPPRVLPGLADLFSSLR